MEFNELRGKYYAQVLHHFLKQFQNSAKARDATERIFKTLAARFGPNYSRENLESVCIDMVKQRKRAAKLTLLRRGQMHKNKTLHRGTATLNSSGKIKGSFCAILNKNRMQALKNKLGKFRKVENHGQESSQISVAGI